MESVALMTCGTCFFISMHFCSRKLLQIYFPKQLTEANIYVIACRFVSGAQAVLASCVGAIIAASCNDIMKDMHWLTNAYVWFGAPYFVYDMWAMYAYYTRSHEQLFAGKSVQDKVVTFVRHNKTMVCHHILLPSILLPLILVLRENRGDFFFGVFYMIELVVPFISAREILIQMGLKSSRSYFVTSLLMVVFFFFCRLAVFPYLYFRYSLYADIPFLRVPYHIPIKCNVSCFLILAPQVYWFALMLRGLYRVFAKLSKKESQTAVTDNHFDKSHHS
ncbi:TLC domain-containing protein 3A [Aplysia californica]|uniref:TLC domain-containing protein 3A n=1 Tax=Aplysia californica TaxID=6500 RepID=A0ABM0K697_APLCA|nr:TLC domain-containing protein 3A [Aplysia californica]